MVIASDGFMDNARHYIIAMDFDNTMTSENAYPLCGKPRRFAKEAVNLLHDLGVKVVIWTCRDQKGDEAFNNVLNYMKDNEIRYDGINSTMEFAPWDYESRKIYAHMYVDDKGFGWNNNDPIIMLKVLCDFMVKIMGIPTEITQDAIYAIMDGREVDLDEIKSYIKSI